MTRPPTFNHFLEEWLDDGPEVAPQGLLDTVLDAVQRRPQHRSGVLRRFPMLTSTVQRAVAVAAVLVVAIVGLTLASRGSPATGGPTASASPTASVVAVAPGSSAATDTCGGALYTPDPGSSPRIANTLMLRNSGAILGAGVTYSTSRFTPAFSFDGQACWTYGGDDATLAIIGDTGSGGVWILRPSAVIDNGIGRPLPADLVGWIRANTGLSIGKPESTSVGGFSGTLLPGIVRSTAPLNVGGDFNIACDTTAALCVAATNAGGFAGIGFPPNQPFDLIVVSVRGQTLLIALSANAADWPAAQPRLEALVASLKFPA